MRSALSTSDFLAAPWGRYFAGQRFVVFAPHPKLFGLSLIGAPTVDDFRQLFELCQIQVRPDAIPHLFIADTRYCEIFDPRGFAQALEFTSRNREALGANITNAMMLRPGGMVGAAIAGFSRVAKLPHPWASFETEEEGIAYLGLDPMGGRALFRELDTIRESIAGAHPLVQKLRALLEDEGVLAASVAAKKLGTSTRSLQRTLERAGTTYRQETKAIRIRRAKSLLDDESRTLASIAAEIGFASVQRFVTSFRTAVGTTPHVWRRRASARRA